MSMAAMQAFAGIRDRQLSGSPAYGFSIPARELRVSAHCGYYSATGLSLCRVWERNMPIDKSDLIRWESLKASVVLRALADYANEDASYAPRLNTRTARWHASADSKDFEILCTGPKFWDGWECVCKGNLRGGSANMEP